MDPRDFRNIAGTFATGVTIVTITSTSGKPTGMTVNSFTSVSLDPPLVLITVGDHASMYEEFKHVSAFAVNILSEQQEELSRTFASKGADRFAGVPYTQGVSGSPILPDVLGYFDCEVYDRHQAGDHLIIVGRVVDGRVSDGNPLLFVRGQYKTVHEE